MDATKVKNISNEALRLTIPFDLRALADKANLKTYDTALPMNWYEDVFNKTGVWPQTFGFVWCYDTAKVWGEPVPLTGAAAMLLAWYESLL